MTDISHGASRRRFLGRCLAVGGAALLPAFARAATALTAPNERVPRDVALSLDISEQTRQIAGRQARALTINDSLPGPLIELYEGQMATLRVSNHLTEASSIHWHGILLPYQFDGVPAVSFPGIAPGETFEARFPLRQHGTYWYHSHSGVQEQQGVYGPLIVHPAEPEELTYERDHVVVLSDWTFEDPYRLFQRLKQMGDYYNDRLPDVSSLLARAGEEGFGTALAERLDWDRMRMMASDIADVTGRTYTYLMNGVDPSTNWTGLFNPGERVRLRFINASAMSYFNIRIPGLPMTVVQNDGQNVEPVETDEFQLAVAETLDVIVEPPDASAWTIMAESLDRSGYARGTLAPQAGMQAPVPEMRERPRRRMIDMGMAHGAMDSGAQMPAADSASSHVGVDHGRGSSSAEQAGMPEVVARHGPDAHGAGNASVATVQYDRLAEPGTGLTGVGHRVLTYAQLRSPAAMTDRREPSRTVELHLTGNMDRYMWSFDGVRFQDVDETIHFPYGEKVRLTLVNDTMMEHPIHLHGMFFRLENGQGEHLPLKHTISVKPAERLSLLVTADEPGRWALHCHLLYHLEAGMFRVVEVD